MRPGGADCLFNKSVPENGTLEPSGWDPRGRPLDSIRRSKAKGTSELELEEGLRWMERSNGPFRAEGTACSDPGGVPDAIGQGHGAKSLIGLAKGESLSWRLPVGCLPIGGTRGTA